MTNRVTCCPHCSTSFRITDAQLQTAKGAVRCGSCLQIFRAPDHLLPLSATASGIAPSARQSAPEPDYRYPDYRNEDSIDEKESGHDEEQGRNEESGCTADVDYTADRDYSMEPGFEADANYDARPEAEADLWAATANREPSLSDDAPVEAKSATAPTRISPSRHDNALLADDELDAFELDLDEDVLISDDMGLETSGFSLGELSEDFLDSGGKTLKSSLFDRELKVKEAESDHSDESWAEELLQEIETEEAAQAPQPATSDILKSFGEVTTARHSSPFAPDDELLEYDELKDGNTGYHHLATGSFDQQDASPRDDNDIDTVLGERFSARKEPLFSVTGERDSPDAAIENPPAPAAHQPPPAEAALPPPRKAVPAREHDLLLHGIGRAPVEMDWHVEPSPWPQRLLWGGLSLLACVILITQVAYFKFDEYSRVEPWRSAYSTVCSVVGCSLPSLSDPARVKAYNLVVRSNPQADNALIIDSILLNTAGFAQPFPDFALSFTNLQGRELAYRRFTPKEYLGGEMAGATLMPSGQPVHISLEIVDPGADAVNYTATIPRD